MRYFYFFLVGLVALAALYSVTGLTVIKFSQYQVTHPDAKFQIIKPKNSEITIVDFTNYRCGYCKGMHKTVVEALELEKNVTYIPRPILFEAPPEDEDENPRQQPVELEKLAIAAGLQGKFKEMHDTFMEYPEGIIPEDIIKETAELYGIDYAQLVTDAQSEKVKDYLDDNISDMLNFGVETIPSYIVENNIYVIKDTLLDLKKFIEMINKEKNHE